MNEAQKNTLKLAAIIFALSCIFVPYRYGHNAYDITQNVSIGYYMITETPRYKGNNSILKKHGSSYIDFDRLIVTWIGIGIFFGLVYWERADKKPPEDKVQKSQSQSQPIHKVKSRPNKLVTKETLDRINKKKQEESDRKFDRLFGKHSKK